MASADFVVTLFEGESNPDKATVGFTMAANAVQKGHATIIILMAEAVALGLPGACDGIAIGAPFKPLAELLKAVLDGGGRVAVCSSCMIHNGYAAEQMVPDYEIISGGDVVDLLMAAKGSLQVS